MKKGTFERKFKFRNRQQLTEQLQIFGPGLCNTETRPSRVVQQSVDGWKH